MAYKKKTAIYGIPYISSGEKLSGADEERKFRMIDNLLFAANCGVSKALFDDGDYKLTDNKNGTYTLDIIPVLNYTLLGLLNNRLFYSKNSVQFPNMRVGRFYWFYAVYDEDLNLEPSKFRKMASDLERAESPYELLLATLDLRGKVPVLNDEPAGKVYSQDVLAHMSEHSNPHGKDFYQDRMTITESLKVNGKPVYGSIILSGVTAGNSQSTFIPFLSPKFAQVMPMGAGFGETWIELTDEGVKVFNSGMANVPFNIMIFGE